MKTSALALLLVAAMGAVGAFGAETIAPFAKQWLCVDLDAVHLGKVIADKKGFGNLVPPGAGFNFLPQDHEIIWMTNGVSAKFSQDYPNRVLAFGFRNDRMVAVRVSLSAIEGMKRVWANPGQLEPEEAKQARAELYKIQTELVKAGPGQKMNYDDGHFKIDYVVNCTPALSDIVYCVYQISVIEKGAKN